ncbi:MAG: kinD [Gammaproteobacteria bacterium]|nr:kinD [Gammaproteobacteria bacterium]
MPTNIFNFKTIAIASFSITSILAIALLLKSDSVFFLSLASTIQLIFYILSLIILFKADKNFSQYEKITFTWLKIAVFFIILKDIVSDQIEIIMKQAQIFASVPSADSKFAFYIYITIRCLDLLVYLTLLCFLISFLRKFFWQRFSYKQEKYYSIFILLIFLMLFKYSQPGTLNINSFFSVYNYSSTALKLIIFVLSMYAILHSRSRTLDLLSSSIILLIAAQFVAYFYYAYHVLEAIESLPDVTWLLASLLTFLGCFYLLSAKDYNFKSWLAEPNSLEAKLAFRTFLTSGMSLILFFILAYTFQLIDGRKILWLFLFVMVYCMAAVFTAKQLARSFAKPFTLLQKNMDKLLASETIPARPEAFFLGEFNFLQNFIYDRLLDHIKQAKKIDEMGKLAIQVAHDIRSPAAAIMMLSKECITLPEDQRIALREAASRVQDIANNLLTEYQENIETHNVDSLMVYPVISSLISEKRAQYRNQFVSFNLEVEGSYFSHIKVNSQEFKRLISNIINNSIEASGSSQDTSVHIKITTAMNSVIITIVDNGPGISTEVLNKLKAGEICSTKPGGNGLGLKQAHEFVNRYGGHFAIDSSPNGVKINLDFELEATPCWLADQINFYANGEIIVLDDDITIHGAWKRRFENWLGLYPELKISYFNNAKAGLKYMESLSAYEAKNALLLSDYEFIGQDLTGLDVIEEIKKLKNIECILVTSYYELSAIIKRAILINTKILPKTLAPEVTLGPYTVRELVPEANADVIVLEDQKELASVLQFLAKSKDKNICFCINPYELFRKLVNYPKNIPICLDYDLKLPVTGLDIAKVLHSNGFINLNLATCYLLNKAELPEYLHLLSDKKAMLSICFSQH